jgi:hypothetical protein
MKLVPLLRDYALRNEMQDTGLVAAGGTYIL